MGKILKHLGIRFERVPRQSKDEVRNREIGAAEDTLALFPGSKVSAKDPAALIVSFEVGGTMHLLKLNFRRIEETLNDFKVAVVVEGTSKEARLNPQILKALRKHLEHVRWIQKVV